MRWKPDFPRIFISAGACFFFVLALLLVPLKWFFSFVFASIVHEAGHYICIKLLGGSVSELRIHHMGAEIMTQEMSKGRELLSSLAGPAAGLLLILFKQWIPEIAVCAMVQCMFNLLPLYPLDGGRALNAFLRIVFSEVTAARIQHCAEVMCLAFISLLALYISVWLRLGLLPLLFGAAMILKVKKNSLQTA